MFGGGSIARILVKKSFPPPMTFCHATLTKLYNSAFHLKVFNQLPVDFSVWCEVEIQIHFYFMCNFQQ